MDHLRKLLAGDLSKATPEELADGVREAELLFDKAQLWSGRLITELRGRGGDTPTSWGELNKLTGVGSSTLRYRVATFEKGRAAGEEE